MRLFLNRILFLLILLALLSCKRKHNSVDKIDHRSERNVTINRDQSGFQVIENPKTPTIQTNLEAHSIISWNIQDFGQSRNEAEIKAIANIVRDFDLILIQEVVAKHPGGAQAVARLADELNRMGAKWDYSISDPTQSPSAFMSERYAFLWKTAKVTLKSKPVLDNELSLLVYREPYIAKFLFKGSSMPVTVINYHSRKYDENPEEEIKHFINYNRRLVTENIILCGDFNLDEKHSVWDPFYNRGYKNALSNTPTTLKMKCKNGRYLNHSIDNIYMQGALKIIETGSLDFIKTCDNLISARMLSDHLPVYVRFIIN